MAGFARVCEGVTAGLALVLAGSPLSAAETVMERPFSKHAMVVSACPLASEAGVEIMRHGGNAFDAAACTGFVMAVTWPEAGNLGGGGLMAARKGDGEVVTLDFRETAPAAARRSCSARPAAPRSSPRSCRYFSTSPYTAWTSKTPSPLRGTMRSGPRTRFLRNPTRSRKRPAPHSKAWDTRSTKNPPL